METFWKECEHKRFWPYMI